MIKFNNWIKTRMLQEGAMPNPDQDFQGFLQWLLTQNLGHGVDYCIKELLNNNIKNISQAMPTIRLSCPAFYDSFVSYYNRAKNYAFKQN